SRRDAGAAGPGADRPVGRRREAGGDGRRAGDRHAVGRASARDAGPAVRGCARDARRSPGPVSRPARIRVLAAVAALLACGPPAAVADEFTPVTAAPVGGHPGAVPGTDGRFHLVYELALTNTKAAPATLGAVTVRAR